MPPTESTLTDSRLATLCSEQVRQAFQDYQIQFRQISQRARQRFLERDWRGSYADAAERLRLYAEVIDALADKVRTLMGERFKDRRIWLATKAVYSSLISQSKEWEIAESFFNSLTRRVFATEGVDQAIEFVDTDFDSPPAQATEDLRSCYEGQPLSLLLETALTACFERCLWEDLDGQAGRAAGRIEAVLGPGDFRLEMVTPVFFRGPGAYVVGRAYCGETSRPLALCLRHENDRGISLDAVLVDELDLSILFSYTRAYFRVVVDCPYELVRELRSLLPRKPVGDLYNAIGYHRHGKTELYRDFVAYMRRSNERFVPADGARGMVMLVFTMPGYDVVFKLIRDRFDFPKEASRSDVLQRYRLVFEHDRAGRLVEAHQFEHLRIPRDRFAEDLLEILLRDTGETVRVEGRDVLIDHCYVERRVRPLNLFLNEAEPQQAVAAALDYAQAIKDLAASNIFAGDIFTKNFGVTRNGRVVFYDYDELCFLTDCNFRNMPQPTTDEQEVAGEPWFSVRENDIFPEEFPKFLGIPEPAWSALRAEHDDLFHPDFWRGVQAKLRAGEIPEVFPYKAAHRL
ncbi:MAG: bifunctional isocitrate dehydrogenase kinase/phosphatase [Vulcanimicrobiota bacterium]